MATSTVSVSFANGFIGDYSKNNESTNASLLSTLGWSNLQFVQSTDNGQFGGTQGNDYSGTILVTDANGVQHAIDGVINWRAPSGTVSTIVFYAKGASHTLATSTGTYVVDPFTETNGDPHSFIGLTFNGQALTITGGKVTGNAATSGLLSTLNTYLANQPQISVADVAVNEGSGMATITVVLSKATSDTVTVDYATGNGTASAGTDYTAASGKLTFAAGQTSKTFQVPITDNMLVDGARSFNVVLSNSTLAAITDNTAVISISDNDSVAPPAPTVSTVAADSSVVEGNSLSFTVTMSAAGGSSQEYALTLGGTASAGDYGTLSFSNGVAWKNGNAGTGIVVVPAGVASFKVTVA
ncbi:Calx-beta domain-containing protein, partial [Pseudoduganella sp.]|uniref:Calx-beta domain-containing protein n=1 Tax=Pseudoduganella sp. TaxID=1880898 RepID=UPI0035B45A70